MDKSSNNSNRIGCVMYILLSIVIALTTISVTLYPAKGFGTFLGIDIVVFFFLCTSSSKYYREKQLAKLPELTNRAKLIVKSKEDRRLESIYYLTFELEDSSRKLFKVKNQIYNTVLEGEWGILRYKEQKGLIELLDFNRDDIPAV